MTPERLREIAEAATPGPWITIDARIGDSSWIQIGTLRNKSVTADVGDVANAALIVLAPDLARVAAELAEALEQSATLDYDDDMGRWMTRTVPADVADAALAAFDQLGEQDDTQAATANDGEDAQATKGTGI